MRKNLVNHDFDSDFRFNCIFGIFEAGGSIISSIINKEANDETNESNEDIHNKEMDYKKSRDEIEDERYADETAYNRAFAEEERDYKRAFEEENRDYNRAFAENERDYNRAFAEDERSWSRDFAINQREYERALQQEIFDREDTSYQRTVEDMSKAGVNPLSMSGLNGSGSVVSASSSPSVTAPSATSPSANAPSANAPSASSRKTSDIPPSFRKQAFTNFQLQGLEPSLEFLNQIDSLRGNALQRDLLQQQINYQRLQNQMAEYDLGVYARNKDTEYKNNKATADRNERVNRHQQFTGIDDTTPESVRTATAISNLLNDAVEGKSDLGKKLKTTLKDRANEVDNPVFTTVIDNIKSAEIANGVKNGNGNSGFLNTLGDWWKYHWKKYTGQTNIQNYKQYKYLRNPKNYK